MDDIGRSKNCTCVKESVADIGPGTQWAINLERLKVRLVNSSLVYICEVCKNRPTP
jgi:hypothetical protein